MFFYVCEICHRYFNRHCVESINSFGQYGHFELFDLIREFVKPARYKVNIQTPKSFLYTNNEISETEIRKKSHLIQQQEKVPRNKHNQGGKDLYSENYRTLKKEIKEDTNKWKHIPCSWIRRLTSLKWPYLPKPSIDSTQSLSRYQWHISHIQKKYFKSLYETINHPEQPQKS